MRVMPCGREAGRLSCLYCTKKRCGCVKRIFSRNNQMPEPTNRRINRHQTAAPNLLHRHCGEALHLFLEHEAGLVFLILDQFAVADDLAQLGDH